MSLCVNNTRQLVILGESKNQEGSETNLMTEMETGTEGKTEVRIRSEENHRQVGHSLGSVGFRCLIIVLTALYPKRIQASITGRENHIYLAYKWLLGKLI